MAIYVIVEACFQEQLMCFSSTLNIAFYIKYDWTKFSSFNIIWRYINTIYSQDTTYFLFRGKMFDEFQF